MMGMGVDIPRSRLQVLQPQGIYQRMCANLIDIYNTNRDHDKQKMVLDLAVAINPQVSGVFCCACIMTMYMMYRFYDLIALL